MGSHISNFREEHSAAVLLEAGARATFHATTFTNNSAISAGPVAGLRSHRRYGKRVGAVAWFQDCHLINNTARRTEDVTIEDQLCRVFSSDRNVSVSDESCHTPDRLGQCSTSAIWLKPRASAANSSMGDAEKQDVFVDVSGKGQPLPRPSDTAFRQIAGSQAARTGMPYPQLPVLPWGTFFLVYYSKGSEWQVGLICAFVFGGVFLCCVYRCCRCRRRKT
eukprot:jgi/Ulvmu1/1572/UM110_0035.1